jgi:hypothetical protein
LGLGGDGIVSVRMWDSDGLSLSPRKPTAEGGHKNIKVSQYKNSLAHVKDIEFDIKYLTARQSLMLTIFQCITCLTAMPICSPFPI